MIVSAGLADPWVGITLPSAMNRFGHAPDAVVGVDDAVLGVGSHPAAADEVGVAVDRQDVLGAGRLQDLAQRALGVGDVLAVVVALAVVHPRDGDAVLVCARRWRP